MLTHPTLRFNLNDTSDKTFQLIKADKNWLYHCLPIIALQRPTFKDGVVDVMDIMSRLKVCSYEYEGFTIPGTQILSLWKFLLNTNRSQIVADSLVKVPMLSTAVPLVLWAYKQTHDVPYSAWKSSPFARNVLGKDLAFLVDPLWSDWNNLWSDEELVHVRNIALTELKTETRKEDTSYKMNKVAGKYMDRFNSFDELPKLMKYMLLQTWIYHPSIRKPNMILDWKDWDIVPPSRYGTALFTNKEDNKTVELRNEADDIFDSVTFVWDAR